MVQNNNQKEKIKETVNAEIVPPVKSGRLWLFLSISSGFLFLAFLAAAYFTYAFVFSGQGRLFAPAAEKRSGIAIEQPGSPEEDGMVRRLIDGIYVFPGEDNLIPVGVVIDNHPDARPSAGLGAANLVFETETEGGLTRYLAFYSGRDEIPEIGPVRSARSYFLDWIIEFGACFSHCGGSPEALARIIKEEVCDLNEFYQGAYYWRAANRPAPHNVFTSAEKLNDYLVKKNISSGQYYGWQFKDDEPPAETATTTDIKIADFKVSWEYDRETNSYIRKLNGKNHTETDGNIIKAKNIAVILTEMKVLDELLRLRITTIGEGNAVVCRDGLCAEGKWRKPGLTARTRFYDLYGNEFMFNAGPTWVEVVREGSAVEY